MMMRRIFDALNEKDKADLFDILPKEIVKIELYQTSKEIWCISDKNEAWYDISDIFTINWHDKTEIRRPVQEATEADVGKLCMFWDYEDMPHYGVLREIDEESIYKDGVNLWKHCRRLTKQEIEELC